MKYVYEGRMELGDFGQDFLPDAETEFGDVPNIGRWIEDQLGIGQGIKTVRIRLSVELIDR